MTKTTIAGWALTGLVAAFLSLVSASGKLLGGEAPAKMYEHIGWTPEVMFGVGVAEVACVALFLIPRTAFFGAVLLTAYLGGATAAHVRLSEAFFVPIVIATVVWVALGLRDRRVFSLAFGPGRAPTPEEAPG